MRRSRAHATEVLDDGRVVSTDLGYDLVRFWTYDDADGLVLDHEVVLAADTGPRHLVQHPDGRILVATEYSCEVVVLEQSGDEHGAPYVVAASAAAVHPEPGDTAAEIALSPDGRFAYVGVRGSDRLSTLAVDNGRLERVAVTPSGGRCPRHHLVGDGVIHVAHEESNEITTLELNPDSGIPGLCPPAPSNGVAHCLGSRALSAVQIPRKVDDADERYSPDRSTPRGALPANAVAATRH